VDQLSSPASASPDNACLVVTSIDLLFQDAQLLLKVRYMTVIWANISINAPLRRW
jgi:hypothetical protein